MKYFFLFFLFVSCSAYGMQESGLGIGERAFIQKCATILYDSNKNFSQEAYVVILTKSLQTHKNESSWGKIVLPLRSIAAELTQHTGTHCRHMNEYALGQAFQNLSSEERRVLRQQ